MTRELAGEALPPLTSIGWFNGKVRYIDQRLLPIRHVVIETDDWENIAEAIRTLAVRGAPLIGISAAYAVVLAARLYADSPDFRGRISNAIEALRATRPTAVNLFWALNRMDVLINHIPGNDQVLVELLKEAEHIHRDDNQRCRAIGENAQDLVKDEARILTVCNAGFLATGGIGTALAAIYKARELGKVIQVYSCETRPLLQGARLTAWEMMRAGIPVTLVIDSVAAGLAARGEIDLCIIGADRIAANGDVVNKIGSYQVALACWKHNIPFYVAAPFSTIDFDCQQGEFIPIEQRHPDEVLEVGGIRVAAMGVSAANPAFDLVPADLVSGIITEKGLYYAPYRFTKSVNDC